MSILRNFPQFHIETSFWLMFVLFVTNWAVNNYQLWQMSLQRHSNVAGNLNYVFEIVNVSATGLPILFSFFLFISFLNLWVLCRFGSKILFLSWRRWFLLEKCLARIAPICPIRFCPWLPSAAQKKCLWRNSQAIKMSCQHDFEISFMSIMSLADSINRVYGHFGCCYKCGSYSDPHFSYSKRAK